MTRRRWSPREKTGWVAAARRASAVRALFPRRLIKSSCLLTLCPDSEPSQIALYASRYVTAGREPVSSVSRMRPRRRSEYWAREGGASRHRKGYRGTNVLPRAVLGRVREVSAEGNVRRRTTPTRLAIRQRRGGSVRLHRRTPPGQLLRSAWSSMRTETRELTVPESAAVGLIERRCGMRDRLAGGLLACVYRIAAYLPCTCPNQVRGSGRARESRARPPLLPLFPLMHTASMSVPTFTLSDGRKVPALAWGNVRPLLLAPRPTVSLTLLVTIGLGQREEDGSRERRTRNQGRNPPHRYRPGVLQRGRDRQVDPARHPGSRNLGRRHLRHHQR